jgi:hypothetical protein
MHGSKKYDVKILINFKGRPTDTTVVHLAHSKTNKPIKSYDHVGVPSCCHVNTLVQGDIYTHVILNCSLHVCVLVHSCANLWIC